MHAPLSPRLSRSSDMPHSRRTVVRAALLFVVLVPLYILLIRAFGGSHSTSFSHSKGGFQFSHLHQLSLSFGASPVHPQTIATASCEVCILKSDDPMCEYGLDNVRMSRGYEGSGYRVRKFIEKALRGEKVTIGVSLFPFCFS